MKLGSIKSSRRGFLGFLGGAAAAGPAGAKAAAEKAAMDLSGTVVGGVNVTSGLLSSSSDRSMPAAFKLCGGVPDFIKVGWVEDARRSAKSSIDPDLAVLRSTSLMAKISIQTSRNIAKEEREAWDTTSNLRDKWFRKWVFGQGQ